MCGFVGYKLNQFDGSFNRELITSAIETIHHRGPDYTGFWESPIQDCAFAHKRLSILDLSDSGNQPFLNPEKNIVVVFNGEIYNYLILKEELLALGYHFHSSSDTEVINLGFSAWGAKLFSKLEGMFSIAILDIKKNKIFLARDRAGEKPLFYYKKDKSIFFSSEIKPLISLDIFRKKIDFHSLGYLFTRGYTPSTKSIFHDVSKLNAAHYLEFNCSSGLHKIHKFWDLEEKINKRKVLFDDQYVLVKKLESLLENSINKQLHADVPVGMLLSGGLDSSLLVALASRQHDNLKTFNVTFKNHKSFNESDHANLIANTFKTDHHEIESSNIDPSMFDRLSEYYDDPIFDTSMIPTFFYDLLTDDY